MPVFPLALPAPDVDALVQGRMILAMPQRFLPVGKEVLLYPLNLPPNSLSLEEYYRPSFVPIAQSVLAELNSEKVLIKAWARCELCQTISTPEILEDVSCLTIWTTEALKHTLSDRRNLVIAYLRVYRLNEPVEVDAVPNPESIVGKFVSLPNLQIGESQPVLSETIFAQRRYQLENRLPPQHPQLEELQAIVAEYAITHPEAKSLDQDIQQFLGWSQKIDKNNVDSDLDWTNTIAALGDRSIEKDEGKSNYQAGTDFENIVRKSLEFLGFTVDEEYQGGAGGLDLFCSKPYPLVGECKAGKKIPSETTGELLRLGGMHLGGQEFLLSSKLIIGPGNPAPNLLRTAEQWNISISNAMSLQKLVQLQAKYRNSVNLIELKPYLEPGQIDDKIEEYVETVLEEVKLRSQIVQVVKELAAQKEQSQSPQSTENTKYSPASSNVSEVRAHYNAKYKPQPWLNDEQVKDLLVELSSPLAGYLGRDKDNNSFYFLRDLETPEIEI